MTATSGLLQGRQSRNLGLAVMGSLLALVGACTAEPSPSTPATPIGTEAASGPSTATPTSPVQISARLAEDGVAYAGPDTFAYEALRSLNSETEVVAVGRYGRFVRATGGDLGTNDGYIPDRALSGLESAQLPVVPVWELPPIETQSFETAELLTPTAQTRFTSLGGLRVPADGAILADVQWLPSSSGFRLVIQYQSPLSGLPEWQLQRVEVEISPDATLEVRTSDGSEAQGEGEEEVTLGAAVSVTNNSRLLVVFTIEGGRLKTIDVLSGDDPNASLVSVDAADFGAPFILEELPTAYIGVEAISTTDGAAGLESLRVWTVPGGDRDAASWLVDASGEPVPAPSDAIHQRPSDTTLLARWGNGAVAGIDFSQDGSLLAVSTSAGSVRLFSTQTWDEVQHLETGLLLASGALSFSPDGRSVGLVSQGGRVGVWDLDSGNNRFMSPQPMGLPLAYPGAEQRYADGIEFSEDGSLLAVTYRGGLVQVLQSSDGTSLAFQVPGPSQSSEPGGAATSADLHSVAGSAPNFGTFTYVRTVDWQTWVPTLVTSQRMHARAVSPDGSIVVGERYTNPPGTQLQAWQESSTGFDLAWVTFQPADLEGDQIGGTAAEFLAGGSRLGVYSEYGPSRWFEFTPRLGRIEVWDVALEESLGVLVFPLTDNPIVAFGDDGITIAFASSRGTVDVVTLPDGETVGSVSVAATCAGNLVLSPDGNVLAGFMGNEIDLCGTSDGRVLHRILVPTDRVTSVAFSPDSQTLVSTGWAATHTMGLDTPYDPNVYLWSVQDGSLIRSLNRQQGNIVAAAFSPDGESLLTAGGSISPWICVDSLRDTSIVVWRVSDWAVLETRSGPPGGVGFLGFSGDGQYYAIGSNKCYRGGANNRAWLFDADTGAQLSALASSGWPFDPMGMSPTGQYVALGDGDLWWYDVPGGELTGHARGPITSFAFSPGDQLVAVSVGTSVALLDISGSRLTTLTAPFRITSLVFSADGALLLGSGTVPGVILVWGISDLPRADPYSAGMIELTADQVLQMPTGDDLNGPRGIAIASDGSLYVADTGNHRVVHFSSDGELLHAWGSYSADENAPAGTFNEPWGVAVAPDGTVYVADTWHHRVQHFDADGDFLDMIRAFTYYGSPQTFWGPRAVAVDSDGRLFVADTGNSRIVVFDSAGTYQEVIGEAGFDLGQFSEPVGVAVSQEGDLYVADTWNGRVQVLHGTEATAWPIERWFVDSADNKPFVAVSGDGRVCLAVPDQGTILCFTEEGAFVLGWDPAPPGREILPAGVAFDQTGHVWVADGHGTTVRRFSPPWP